MEALLSFGQRLEHWLTTHADDTEPTLESVGLKYKNYRRIVTDPTVSPKTGLLVQIGERFPACNLEWLLTGQGEPLWEPDRLTRDEPSVFDYKRAICRRHSLLKKTLPLASDAAKAAMLPEALRLLDILNEDNEHLVSNIEKLAEMSKAEMLKKGQ